MVFKIKIILIPLFSMLLIQECIPVLRSSKSLKPGEVSVCYNAPFAGDIRVGITNFSEYRYSVIGEGFETDLLFHCHRELDYSLAIGIQWLPNYEKDYFHFLPYNTKKLGVGFTGIISNEIYDRFNPYIGFSISKPYNEILKASKVENFYTIGCESRVFKDGRSPINFSLTPEFIYIPQGTGGDFNTFCWGSVGIGIIIDFEKIINKKKKE